MIAQRLLDLMPARRARIQAERRLIACREARLSDLANPEIADALRVLMSREHAVRAALGELDDDGGAPA